MRDSAKKTGRAGIKGLRDAYLSSRLAFLTRACAPDFLNNNSSFFIHVIRSTHFCRLRSRGHGIARDSAHLPFVVRRIQTAVASQGSWTIRQGIQEGCRRVSLEGPQFSMSDAGPAPTGEGPDAAASCLRAAFSADRPLTGDVGSGGKRIPCGACASANCPGRFFRRHPNARITVLVGREASAQR